MKSLYESILSTTNTGRVSVLHEIDLGLSVDWANMNLGAKSPTEVGMYYAFGDTQGYYSSKSEGVPACDSDTFTLERYKTLPFYEEVNKILWSTRKSLDLKYDAAHVSLGGKWRMPTNKELDELLKNTHHKKVNVNGVECLRLTSKTSDNFILIPTSDWIINSGHARGYATFRTSGTNSGLLCNFSNCCVRYNSFMIGCGIPIRPIREK